MTERIGPYRVYERLGVGGMGEVFKAYDDRLDRWVAIKRIRPDRLDAEDNRERFKREARATARLNHPSIVHLYGIFQDEEDADCIVMEFVDGRTLDTFLSEGPLEPSRVARLGHEIASGLAEAHANGILHRDLKAENIMITPRGRAKILDFGLAKPILASELDPVLTSKGQLVGTSRAMSPEYVSGEEVDHRSDLFALGVLLYECLTGQSPFKAHNTLATLKQVMLHKQAPVKQLNAEVPPDLSELIDRLLSKDPNDRPQSAEEVALSFGRVTGQVSSGIIDTPNFGSGSHPQTGGSTTTLTASDTVLDLRPRNRRMAVFGILIVALLGAFFLGRLFVGGDGGEPELPPDERIHIVLGEFANSTGEEVLGDSLAEAFRAVLDQSRSNVVLSRSQLRDTLQRMQLPSDTVVNREVGVEICEREGAERLVVGSVSKIGQNYSIVVDVVDPAEDRNTLSATKSARGQDELLSAIEELAQNVRAHLGESVAEIERAVPLEKVTTSNLDALKAYTIGQNHMADGSYEEAVDFFQRAVTLDKTFAMAYAKLGVAHNNIGDLSNAVSSFKEALELEDGLSEFQKLYLKGWLARWEGSPEEVIDNFSLMAELYPENYIATYNLGLALWVYRNDFENAGDALKVARDSSRGAERSLAEAQLGKCLLALEQNQSAREALEASEHGERWQGLVALALADGHIEEAEQVISRRKNQGANLLDQALIAATIGDLSEAQRLLVAAETLAVAENNFSLLYDSLADQAALALFSGQEDQLDRIVKRSLGYSSEPQAEDSGVTPVPLLQQLARFSFRAGNLESGLAALEKMGPVTKSGFQVETAFRLAVEAEKHLLQGDLSAALERASQASATAESVQLKETLAYIQFRAGKREASSALYSEVSRRPGLGHVECMSYCPGRLYSALLPSLVEKRLAQTPSDFSKPFSLGTDPQGTDPQGTAPQETDPQG